MVCSSPLSVALPHVLLLLLISAFLVAGQSLSVFGLHSSVTLVWSLCSPSWFVVGPVAKALLLQSYPCVATDNVMKFSEVTCLSVLTLTTWAYSACDMNTACSTCDG